MTKPVSGWAIVHKKCGILPHTMQSKKKDCISFYTLKWIHRPNWENDTWNKLQRQGYSCEKVTITIQQDKP